MEFFEESSHVQWIGRSTVARTHCDAESGRRDCAGHLYIKYPSLLFPKPSAIQKESTSTHIRVPAIVPNTAGSGCLSTLATRHRYNNNNTTPSFIHELIERFIVDTASIQNHGQQTPPETFRASLERQVGGEFGPKSQKIRCMSLVV